MESCQNCLDDDGDGLVDAQDADCCTPAPLALQKAKFLARKGVTTNGKLLLKAALDATGIDPTAQQLTLLVTNAGGVRFCQPIGSSSAWKAAKRGFQFKGTSVGGLSRGKLKLSKKGGSATLTLLGSTVDVSGIDASAITVSVGASTQCAGGTMSLRQVKKGFVGP